MIKILVLTDEFEKWIEKFEESLKVNWNRRYSYKMRDSIVLRNDLFSIEIVKRISENQRGKVIDVAILDKWIENEKEWFIRVNMMGHRNSIIKTEGYWEEDREKMK